MENSTTLLTRQDKTRQDKTRQDKTRQDKTRQDKTIILALPYLFGLDQCIEKNLRYLGYNVINLCYDESRNYFPTFFHRLWGWGIKLLDKSRYQQYKKSQTFSRYLKDIKEKLSKLENNKADFALCIRADIYPKSIISLIRQHSKKCVNFHWDGVSLSALEYLSYFDRFFVFDPNDVTKYPQYNFQHLTNFYFDYDIPKNNKHNDNAFFLGGYQSSRTAQIQHFITSAKHIDLPLDFYLVARDERARVAFNNDPAIHYINSTQSFSFEQNLSKVQESHIVVDFLNPVHKGLSFRSFDALGFNKKLITTNDSVMKYDFYHPNNILVWNEKISPEQLSDFLALPYLPIPDEIKQKYSFTAWLKKVMQF